MPAKAERVYCRVQAQEVITMRSVLVLLACVACGTDSSNDTAAPQEPAQSMAYMTAAELPACDASRLDHLAYVADTRSLQFCDGTTWQPAPLSADTSTPTSVNVKYILDVIESCIPEATGCVGGKRTYPQNLEIPESLALVLLTQAHCKNTIVPTTAAPMVTLTCDYTAAP